MGGDHACTALPWFSSVGSLKESSEGARLRASSPPLRRGGGPCPRAGLLQAGAGGASATSQANRHVLGVERRAGVQSRHGAHGQDQEVAEDGEEEGVTVPRASNGVTW